MTAVSAIGSAAMETDRCAAAAGRRRRRCACCTTTCIPTWPRSPTELVVYGGIGKAARNWSSFHTIERELQRLGDAETLLVQSGKPVAVFETHPDAPRVLIANSNLVPQWATWEQVPRARRRRADDVRPDDRRVVDLHRQSGHPPGHLRDLRRRGPQAL